MGTDGLLSLEKILNTIGISGVLFYFLSPTIVALLSIYTIRRIRYKLKLKAIREKEEALQKKKLAEAQKLEQSTIKKNTKQPSKSGTNLYLEFDTKGEIKNGEKRQGD